MTGDGKTGTEQPEEGSGTSDPTDETAMTGAGPDQDAEPPGEDGQSAGTAQRPPSDS